MSVAKRVLAPFKGYVDRRLDFITTPRLDDLSGQIEDVRLATLDVRRIVSDDLDASNETAALLGRALAELQDAVASLRADLDELRSRLPR
ncbi:MAG TPA: hypothetical protein VHN98_12350 [Acidimicrobiales bacterium]|nr:hypothetical protein [Acidimicrobiales bacterium]